MRRTCLILLLTVTLAACKGGEKPAQNATAGGEILQGSVSDAMLPLDQVRSQPPLAPPPSGEPGKHAARDEADAAADQADLPPAEAPAGDADAPAGAEPKPGAE